MNYAGAPVSAAFSTPALTITDLDEMECPGNKYDKNERNSGGDVDPSITLGNRKFEATIKSPDIRIMSSMCDGMIVRGVQLRWQAAATSASPDGTVERTNDTWGWDCSVMMVDGDIGVKTSADKKVNVFEVKLKACKDPSTGLDSTVTPHLPS